LYKKTKQKQNKQITIIIIIIRSYMNCHLMYTFNKRDKVLL